MTSLTPSWKKINLRKAFQHSSFQTVNWWLPKPTWRAYVIDKPTSPLCKVSRLITANKAAKNMIKLPTNSRWTASHLKKKGGKAIWLDTKEQLKQKILFCANFFGDGRKDLPRILSSLRQRVLICWYLILTEAQKGMWSRSTSVLIYSSYFKWTT